MDGPLPRRRHQEPAQLSGMATSARGLGRPGHSAKLDPRRHRNRPLSTGNAISAKNRALIALTVGMPRRSQADMAPNPSRRRQARPSKSKPRQANPNKIAWICLVLFVRIGTYQWVTAIPTKNFFSPPSLLPRRATPGRALVSDYCDNIAQLPIFARREPKKIVAVCLI